jgi:hypothetical protein
VIEKGSGIRVVTPAHNAANLIKHPAANGEPEKVRSLLEL